MARSPWWWRTLTCVALAASVGRAEKPHGRRFWSIWMAPPGPGFVAGLGRPFDVNLQPSFVDVRSIRKSGFAVRHCI